METPELVTQNTSIRQADQLLSIEPILVHPEDNLQRVAEVAARQAGARVISVVDQDGRLVGIIPVRVLVNEIFFKIVPEQFLGEIHDYDQVLHYAKHMGASCAGDIMLESTSVHLNDTVRDAFERMHRFDLIGLPIVDAMNKVVGYVDQLELLLVWAQASGGERLLQDKPNAGES